MAGSRSRTNWQDRNKEILGALDLRAEFTDLGLDITASEAREDGWLECRAIGREDTNPSAAVNILSGRYRDLGGEGLSLSFWDLGVHLRRFPNWKAAQEHYAAKAGVLLNDECRDPAEHLVFLPWKEGLATLWCRFKPGITAEAIRAAGGRLARYRDRYTVIAVPMFGQAFTAADPVGWVLWNCNGQELPIWRGKAVMWAKIKTTGGSVSGLIGQHALDRLTSAQADPTQQIIWKVEGPSDLLSLWAAIPPDRRDKHLVITNGSGAGETPKPWMAQVFTGRRVGVVPDCDKPGQAGGQRWAEFIAGPGGAVETRLATLPYEITADHGRDLRDWLVEGNGLRELLKLAEEGENIAPTQGAGQGGDPGGLQVIEDDDDAHRLARLNLERYARFGEHGRTLRLWRDEWYVWRRNAYRRITEKELRAKLCMAIKAEFDRQNIEAQLAATADSGKIVCRKVTTALTSNVLQATGGMVVVSSEIEPGTWMPTRERRNFISMMNGLLDVDLLLAGADDCLIPNSPDWFSMVSLPYAFDPYALCPRWDAFLEHNLEMDPERIKLVQEWAGYLLLPDTGEQKFLINEGEGANGKSVYTAAVTAMLGEENVSTVPLEVFGDQFSKTDTLGKLLNAAGDCAELDKVAEGFVKSFTSGDRMFFNRKGVPGVNCRPTARMMVSCNNRPRFSDRSQGIWRRMLLVPWRVEIGKDMRVRNMDKVEWWQNSGELPGIFRWALAGLARLRAQCGFTECSLMEQAISEYQEEMNPAKVFLRQHVEKGEGAILSKELYAAYRRWAHENGYMPLSERPFGREVFRQFKGIEKRQTGPRTNRSSVYFGLKYSVDEICGEQVGQGNLF